MEQYWVPHEELVWAPWFKASTAAAGTTFESGDGAKIVIPGAKAADLDKVHETQLEGVDNVCKLDDVNAGALLHTVRKRYMDGLIYTRVARILVAVNPFRPMSIYSAEHVDMFMKAADSLDLEPHVYGIGLDAVHGLRTSDNNQAVLISGESGAGKTESTKLVLAYIAEAIAGSGNIQEQILQTNPVLEAFGNAMTVRNNNSSRFGKWLEVSVSSSMNIVGCTVTDYLLEVTRVCHQGGKERNYHIFFQLLQARNDSEMKELGIEAPEKYRYLQGSQLVAPGIDDNACFEESKEAFRTLGFDDAVQMEIFRVVVAILCLGNCDFVEEGDRAKLASEAPAKKAAELLGIATDDLLKAISEKKLVIGKEVTVSPLNQAGACAARDGLSRLLYGRLFKWLIKRVNQALHEGEKSEQFFGVLDIAGFESFEHNSLEQLFINLSNEHLQQHFNNHIFKMELDDYRAEGVTAGDGLTYQDNLDIVQLIGEKGGILSILDEEAIMAKATDNTFASKVFKAHDKHPRLVVPKFKDAGQFGIRHFAGEVTYKLEGFLRKNIDKPPEDAPAMLRSSSLKVLKEVGEMIGRELEEAESSAASKRGSMQSVAPSKKKPKTVSSGFRVSLGQLVDKLEDAEPHFIRCVKPNAEKVAQKFTSKLVMEQLLFSGIMEAVRIRQQGYASRVTFNEFCARFRCIVSKEKQNSIFGSSGPAGAAAKATALLEALAAKMLSGYEPSDFVVGKTKVLAKLSGTRLLEKARDLALSGYALDIQRWRRGVLVRRRMKGVRAVFADIAAWAKSNQFYTKPGSEHTAMAKLGSAEAVEEEAAKLDELLETAASLPVAMPDMSKIRKVQERMRQEADTANQLKASLTSVDPVEIGRELARAKDLDLLATPEAKDLEERCKRLKAQLPLSQAMRDALDASDMDKLQECMDAVKKEGLNLRPENWVTELKASELAGKVYDELERLKTAKKQADIREAQKKAVQAAVTEQAKVVEKAGFEVDEEALNKKKRSRKTITGLSQEDQTKLLLALAAACHEYDAEELEVKLGEATKQGMEAEALQPSQEMMEKLQTEAFLCESIKEWKEQVASDAPPAHALKCLQNLVTQAKRLGVATELVTEVKSVMQQGVRRRARSTVRGSIFDQVDLSDLHLGEEVFSDLANFQNLKPQAQWKGHKHESIFRRASSSSTSDRGGRHPMICHSRQEIKSALTKVPSSQETPAIQQFRNILGWMSDRPIAECQRLGYAQDIVVAAKADASLGDEVFVQVLKQLTCNPSRRSSLLGWKLLLQLCQQVPPSESLEEFLRSFLITSLRENQEAGFDEAVTIAKQCIQDLNLNTKPEKRETEEEDTIPVQVLLIDNSTRKLYVSQKSTLRELGRRIAEMLKVHSSKDFSFFQMTDGLETHRLLPEQTVLSTLCEKWQKLKEVTHRASRLLWKRRFLRVDEMLQAGDLQHATLTYRQALWDYYHYPITEDIKFICEIAATILFLERDHFRELIKTNRLSEPTILEQLLPDHVLRHQKRPKWAAQVTEVFMRLEKVMDPQETRMQQMSRVVSLMQKMKLFGSYFWLGRQTYQIPKEKVPLPEAPSQMCKINPKEPEAEYWVCVDLYGVRFVSVDAAAGTEFQRGFLFNDEAVDRVLLWGAKQNIVQFVVQTVNPAFPSAGRVPMCIALVSPAAVDIAYAVHSISNDRKRL